NCAQDNTMTRRNVVETYCDDSVGDWVTRKGRFALHRGWARTPRWPSAPRRRPFMKSLRRKRCACHTDLDWALPITMQASLRVNGGRRSRADDGYQSAWSTSAGRKAAGFE